MKKRMAESVARDKRNQETQMGQALEEDAAIIENEDQPGGILPPAKMVLSPVGEEAMIDELSGLKFADKFWREYIRDMAQLIAIDKASVSQENLYI